MARPKCQPPEVPGVRLCFGEPSLWLAKMAHLGRPHHPTVRGQAAVTMSPLAQFPGPRRAHPVRAFQRGKRMAGKYERYKDKAGTSQLYPFPDKILLAYTRTSNSRRRRVGRDGVLP
jgi:hypothetical protein